MYGVVRYRTYCTVRVPVRYLQAGLLGELVGLGIREVVVGEGGVQGGYQMEQRFPEHQIW